MTDDLQRAWSRWLAKMNPEEAAAAEALRDRFAQAGVEDPEEWAQSEIDEGIPQMARYLFLRRLWAEAINRWQEQPAAVESFPVAHRLLEAGGERADLVAFARAVAVETISFVAYALDEGYAADLDIPGLPGWRLEETDPTEDRRLTGRHVVGLHESVLETDPSGEWGEGIGD